MPPDYASHPVPRLRARMQVFSFLDTLLVDGAVVIFDQGNGTNKGKEQKNKNNDALVARLYQQIGQLKVERDFLEERSGP